MIIFATCVWGLTETARLTGESNNDYFGFSLAISDSIVVGSYGAEAAYVDSHKLCGAQPDSQFGWDVAVDGDTVIVGAIGDDVARGAAFVFRSLTQTQKLTASDAAPTDSFGAAVAISNGVLVVGAYGDDDAGTGSGSAYVFQGDPFTQTHKLTANDALPNDFFGYAVAIQGSRIVVGAYGADAVYIFDDFVQTRKLTGGAGDAFGFSVAIDQYIVVGAKRRDVGDCTDAGTVYIYDAQQDVALIQTVASPRVTPYDNFGRDVAISQGAIVVGAGIGVYCYAMTPDGGFVQTSTLKASDSAFADNFGVAVAVRGDTVVVGASGVEDAGFHDTGAAYIFVNSSIFSPTPVPAPSREPLPSSSKKTSDTTSLVALIVLPAVVLLAAALYFVYRRRKSRASSHKYTNLELQPVYASLP